MLYLLFYAKKFSTWKCLLIIDLQTLNKSCMYMYIYANGLFFMRKSPKIVISVQFCKFSKLAKGLKERVLPSTRRETKLAPHYSNINLEGSVKVPWIINISLHPLFCWQIKIKYQLCCFLNILASLEESFKYSWILLHVENHRQIPTTGKGWFK